MMNNGMLTNPGMFATTSTQFFDAASGMPIGTPANVITTATGQIVDGNTGQPVIANTVQMNPSGMQMSSTAGNIGFQGTGQFPAMFPNTGMSATGMR